MPELRWENRVRGIRRRGERWRRRLSWRYLWSSRRERMKNAERMDRRNPDAAGRDRLKDISARSNRPPSHGLNPPQEIPALIGRIRAHVPASNSRQRRRKCKQLRRRISWMKSAAKNIGNGASTLNDAIYSSVRRLASAHASGMLSATKRSSQGVPRPLPLSPPHRISQRGRRFQNKEGSPSRAASWLR